MSVTKAPRLSPDTRWECGEVAVSTVDRVLSSRNVRVWQADLATKYAEVLGYGGGGYRTGEGDGGRGRGGWLSVILAANEYSLKVDEAPCPTRLEFRVTGRPSDWCVMADCSRYTLTVVAWRPGLRSRLRDAVRRRWWTILLGVRGGVT